MNMDEHGLVLGLISTLSGILLFLSEAPRRWILDRLSSSNVDPVVWSIHIKRLLGFVWLGIYPFILMVIFGHGSPHFYGFLKTGSTTIWLSTIALSSIVILVNFLNSQTKSNLARYPEIRISNWSAYLVIGSGLTWALYLIAYEFLFRGILLFTSMNLLHPNTAITLNITVYALFHLQKNLKETLASIPFGAILCVLTIESQSIWPAIFLHLVLALSNEWLSIYFSSKKTLKSQDI